MITLTDKELIYALTLQELIKKRGFDNLAKTEFDAGLITGNEFNRILKWLKETNWELADELIERDEKICVIEIKKSKREKNIIDAQLMRRLRNVFTPADFIKLNIKELNYKDALALCEEKERERLKHGVKF